MHTVLDRLGDSVEKLVLERGLVRSEDMEVVREARGSLAGNLGEILISMGFVDEESLYNALAQHLKFPLFDPSRMTPQQEAMELVPAALRKDRGILPLGTKGGRMFVAFTDPSDVMLVDDISRLVGMPVAPLMAKPADLARYVKGAAVARPVRVTESVDDIRLESAEGQPFEQSAEELAAQAPVVRLMNVLLRDAVRAGASDIHIEPQVKDVLIRYRVDGVLHDIMPINKKTMHAPLLSRIKVLAGMDIAESRRPQDGHFRLRYDERGYDLRVSTFPTIYGEKAVLRLLDRSRAAMGLEELGMTHDMRAAVEWIVSRPHGLFLVTGPTGCGKTTTLYSLIRRIHSPEKNFVTIEDPVEFRIARVSQTQVVPRAGITFAAALRNLLRQDPDVIMVGEIRDTETADMAVQAALTGHLVLSTLHTNDAPTTVSRLMEMEVEPFLLADSVIGVLSQRLARRVCPSCCAPYRPPADALVLAGLPPNTDITFQHGKGCQECRNTGYKGRIGLFELLRVDEEIRELIVRRRPAIEVRETAHRKGMNYLREDGFAKAQAGITSLEEVLRVVELGD